MVSEELFDTVPDISANTCFWENPCKQFVPPKMDGVKTINLRIAALISINFHSTNDPSPTESKPPQQRKKTNQVTHDAISQLCFGQRHESSLTKQSKDWKIQWYPVVHKVWPSKIYHRWDMQGFIGSLCHCHLEKKQKKHSSKFSKPDELHMMCCISSQVSMGQVQAIIHLRDTNEIWVSTLLFPTLLPRKTR